MIIDFNKSNGGGGSGSGSTDLRGYWNSAVTEQHIESAASITYASAASYTDQAVAGIDLSAYDTAAVASTKYSKVTTYPVSGYDVDLGFLYIETSGVSKELNIAKINGKAVIGLNQEYRTEFEFPTSGDVQTMISGALSGFTPGGDSAALQPSEDFNNDDPIGTVRSLIQVVSGGFWFEESDGDIANSFNLHVESGYTGNTHGLATIYWQDDTPLFNLTLSPYDVDIVEIVIRNNESDEFISFNVNSDTEDSGEIDYTYQGYNGTLHAEFHPNSYGPGLGQIYIWMEYEMGNVYAKLNYQTSVDVHAVEVYDGVAVKTKEDETQYFATEQYVDDAIEAAMTGSTGGSNYILAAISSQTEYEAISGSVKSGDLIQVRDVDINGDEENEYGLFEADVQENEDQGVITRTIEWYRRDNGDCMMYSGKYYPWLEDNSVYPYDIGTGSYFITQTEGGDFIGIGFTESVDGFEDGTPTIARFTPEYDEQTGEATGMTREDRDILGELDTLDQVVSAALVDLNEKKVESEDIKHIVQLSQAAYDQLATKDPHTFYIITNNSN